MFLRKLFNSENKLTWVLIDFLIVIVGVYCAFLIQEYAANEKVRKEKEEIIAALKYELEFFRVQMPGRAWYSNNQANNWRNTFQAGNYDDFSKWRFIEPQYDYQVTVHALGIQNADIISFDLYMALQNVYSVTRRIEHIERMMTELGMRYQSIPVTASKGTVEYEIIWNRNYDDFDRLILAMSDRAEDLQELGEKSGVALQIINEQLPYERKRSIEENLIIGYVDQLVNNEEEAVSAVGQAYPDFTEEEIRIMYQKAVGAYKEGNTSDSNSN